MSPGIRARSILFSNASNASFLQMANRFYEFGFLLNGYAGLAEKSLDHFQVAVYASEGDAECGLRHCYRIAKHDTIYPLQLALNSLVGLSLVEFKPCYCLMSFCDHFSTASGVCSVSIGTRPVHHTHLANWHPGAAGMGSGVLVCIVKLRLQALVRPVSFCSLLIVSKKKSFK